MKPSEIKLNIRKDLFAKLGGIQGVVSVTLVGSFVDREDLAGISDIDTIVICKSLDKKLFDACLHAVESIDLKKCGLVNYALPEKLYETAYALCCDLAAADGRLRDEELRFLQETRYVLNISRLNTAAIERGARARHMVL